MAHRIRSVLIFGALLIGLLPGTAPAQGEGYVAIHAGKLIIGDGEEKEGVTVLILDGKIEAIGENVDLPYPCQQIDARSGTVMPGLIHPHSRRGLLNYSRTGQQAHLKVLDEFLPTDDAYEEALAAGYTTLVLTPPGSTGIPGQALPIRTADVGQGLVIADTSYVKFNLRRTRDLSRDRKTIADGLKKAAAAIEKEKKAREEWEKKKKEAEEAAKKKAEEDKKKKKEGEEKKEEGGKHASEPPKPEEKPKEDKKAPKVEEFKAPAVPQELQPLVALLRKEEGVFAYIQIGGASTYLHLRDLLDKYEISYVLQGENREPQFWFQAGSDLYRVSEQLGDNEEVVVMTANLNKIPYSQDQNNPPRDVAAAGAKVAFLPASDHESDLEAIRYDVAELVKGGMDRKDALRALHLNTAEAVGLSSRLGSVEVGKDANLVILSGDPLDVQSQVDQVLVEGMVAYERED